MALNIRSFFLLNNSMSLCFIQSEQQTSIHLQSRISIDGSPPHHVASMAQSEQPYQVSHPTTKRAKNVTTANAPRAYQCRPFMSRLVPPKYTHLKTPRSTPTANRIVHASNYK